MGQTRHNALKWLPELVAVLLDDSEVTSTRKLGEKLGITGEYVRQLVETLPYLERTRVRDLLEQNRARAHGVEAFGELKTVAAWSQDPRCRVTRITLHGRLYHGWDVEEAITTPLLPAGGDRPSKLPPDIPTGTVYHLRDLCAAASLVRGGTSMDSPNRAAALERDKLVRELVDAGHTAQQIADETGYSLPAVRLWLRHTANGRARYAA